MQPYSGAGEDLVPEPTCQMETGEGRAERRRCRRRFGSGGLDALRRFWPPQRYHGAACFRYQNRGADTGAREPFGSQIPSPSLGEVREGAAHETDAVFWRGRLLGRVIGIGRRLGTSEHIGEPDRSGTAASGRWYGGRNWCRGWSKGLRGAGASGRSRLLREVVNVVDDELGCATAGREWNK